MTTDAETKRQEAQSRYNRLYAEGRVLNKEFNRLRQREGQINEEMAWIRERYDIHVQYELQLKEGETEE